MEKIPLDRFRLRFSGELEQEFLEDYFQKSLNQLRFGITLGATLYALFGLLDIWIFPDVKTKTWFVRYAVVLPACIAVLLFSLTAQFKKYMQVTVFLLVLVAGAGINAMMVIVQSPVNYFHFAGLLLVIMYSYTFSKLRFLYTTLASWLVVVMYEITALGVRDTPLPVFLNDNFFYIAANLIGMFSSYHREFYIRKDFYQSRTMQVLEKEKHLLEKEQLHETVDNAIKSLRESEEKFRTLAETAAMAIFIHQGGNFLYANRAGEVIGGYTVDEYLSMNFLSIVHPEYVDLVKTRARERLDGGGPPPQYEFKIVRKDGQERWVLMTAGITKYEGKPAVIGTLIDITKRKQAEEERERYYQQLQQATQSLQESEARFRTLAETTTASIVIHRGGRFLYTNPAVQKVTGYTRDEFLKMEFWEIVHPEFRNLVRERGQTRLYGTEQPKEYEFQIVTKQGQARWATTTAGIIMYEGSPAIIATLFDITDRKRAEAEKVKLYEERIAEEKQHLLEKEKILMDLHDGIGGITTNISILSELGQKTADVADIKKTLSTISRLSREGISEIRSFMQSLDTRDLNWRTLAAELRNQGTNMLEPHGIAFDMETALDDGHERPSSLLWVNLFKIYKEALTNVVKHSKAGIVKAVLKVTPSGILLTVDDNGIGWEANHGNGRGLSNMKRRAEEMGARVAVEPGQGTRVRVEIPLPIKYPVQGIEL
ncbi:MAG: PAS domain S-box protein [Betaproteobacteria bacterium]